MAEYNDTHLLEFNRIGKITASLAAAVMGIHPYISRQKAWRIITGNEKKEEPNEHQLHGMEAEQATIEEFQIRTGLLVSPGRFVQHPGVPFLGASPDGFLSDGAPLEAKSMTEDRKNYIDDIAPYYYVQVQVQIQCCKADHGWFIQHGGGHPTLLKRVEEDKKYFWETIYPACHSFYFDYIEKNIPPPRRSKKHE